MVHDATKSEKIDALSSFFGALTSTQQRNIVFDNLFTESEVEKIYDRIKILDCLDSGLSQRKTLEKIGGGIATISRGATMIRAKKFNIFAGILANARQQSWWQKLFWRT